VSEQFILPLGLVSGGTVIREVTLKPMTAGVRRQILNRQSQKNPANGITTMLAQCCELIGSAPASPQLINAMIVGDRDYLLMMLRKISIGDIMPGQLVCPKCQTTIVFDIPIDDVEIRRLEVEKDFRIEGSFAITDLESKEMGIKAALRYPIGHDQVNLADKIKSDPVAANYELMSRLIRAWEKNGKPVELPNSMAFIDSLTIPEIEWLEKEYRAKQPGPQWNIRITCNACGGETPVDLGDVDFLFKTQR
jgi:hypothetical protein